MTKIHQPTTELFVRMFQTLCTGDHRVSLLGTLVGAFVGALAPTQASMGQCPGRWQPVVGEPVVPGPLSGLAVFPDGDVIVDGRFTTVLGVESWTLGRYHPATHSWFPLGAASATVITNALAVFPNGDLAVAGTFIVGGVSFSNRVGIYRPGSDTWSTPGPAVTGSVNPSIKAIASFSNGTVIVGGSFTMAGGVPASNVARFDPSSGVFSALGQGLNGPVFALAALANGEIVAGGQFPFGSSIGENNVGRYIPGANTWVGLSGGVIGPVFAIAVLPGGDLVAGGGFGFLGNVGPYAGGLARYSQTTHRWSAMGSGLTGAVGAHISAIAALGNGDLVVGGSFVTAGGVAANNIARCNPFGGAWSALGSGVNSAVTALVIPPGGDVFAGGPFTIAGGNTAMYFAQCTFRPACASDFDCSGVLSVQDLFAFLDAWFGRDPRADFNGAGGLTQQDVLDYVAAWFVGC